ncbi:MAG TPA: hypothetical protein VNM90_00900 [Haliangium sp.]|nr:hypothetical protein [Haliangium sp.]
MSNELEGPAGGEHRGRERQSEAAALAPLTPYSRSAGKWAM